MACDYFAPGPRLLLAAGLCLSLPLLPLSSALAQGATAKSSPVRLGELYRASLSGVPSVGLRKVDIERAQAAVDAARSRTGFQASWTLGTSYTDYRAGSHLNGTGYRSNLNLRKALIDQAADLRVESSLASVGKSEAALSYAQSALAYDLLDKVLGVLDAEAEISAIDAERESAVRQADRLKIMREKQLARVPDVAEMNAYVLSLNTQLVKASSARRLALAQVSEISGLPVESVTPLRKSGTDQQAPPLENLLAQARERHPWLVSLKAAVEASRHTLAASIAEGRPQLAAVASHVISDQGFDNIISSQYRVANIGLELRVPIVDGGRIDAATRDALAATRATELQWESARREIERDIRNSYLLEQAARAEILSTTEELAAMRQALDAQQKAFGLGLASMIELLEAHKRVHRSESALAKARLAQVRHLANLQVQTGNFQESDIQSWERWFDQGR